MGTLGPAVVAYAWALSASPLTKLRGAARSSKRLRRQSAKVKVTQLTSSEKFSSSVWLRKFLMAYAIPSWCLMAGIHGVMADIHGI